MVTVGISILFLFIGGMLIGYGIGQGVGRVQGIQSAIVAARMELAAFIEQLPLEDKILFRNHMREFEKQHVEEAADK